MTDLIRSLKSVRCHAVATVLLMALEPAAAQAASKVAGYESVPAFGGPTSVGEQLKADSRQKTDLFEDLAGDLESYYAFKARLKAQYGLAIGFDYAALVQASTESLGEDHAVSGAVRLYGTWTLVGRNAADTGSLVFKIENRHRLGTAIAPQDLGGEIGYAGLTAGPFSDAGTILTNFYWHQTFHNNGLAFVAGIVDVTDYIDTYGLVSQWTDFNNQAFGTNPTIPAPSQGLGAAVMVRPTANTYVHAGIADANGDPSDPGNSFDSFFSGHEYFTHVELGWIGSWEDRHTDNIHLTAWHADRRKAADVDDGWGLALSLSRKFDDRWLPFLRIGYADGGGAMWERSVSAGLGYFRPDGDDVMGIGVNWGRPSAKTNGMKLDDQFTAEAFYRAQLGTHLAITPSAQFIVNPALNPEAESLWVFGLRARASF